MSLLRQALGDSVLYAASAVLPRGIMFLLMPLITRLLGPAEYGALDLLVVLGVAVQLVFPLEVSQGLARQWSESNDVRAQRGYASSSLWFSALAYALFAALAWEFAPMLARVLLGDAGRIAVIRMAALVIWLAGLLYLAHQQLRWALRVRAYVGVAMLQALAVPGLAVAAASIWGGLFAFLCGQLAGEILTLGAALFLLRDTYRMQLSMQHLRPMLAFSLPLVPSGIAVLAAQYADRVLVKELLSIEHLGVYSVAARIGSIVALVTMGLQLAVTPLVYRHARDPGMPHAVGRLFRIACGLAIFSATVLGLFSDELVALLAGPNFAQAAPAVYLTALAAPAAGFYVYAPGLAIAKRTSSIAMANAGAAMVGVLLGLLLVPRFSLIGAAAATLGGALTGFAAHVILGQRHVCIAYPWTRALAVLAVSLLIMRYAGADLVARGLLLAGMGLATLLLLWPEPLPPSSDHVRS
jgi:O-antigen/teichoic acid export membrane protein